MTATLVLATETTDCLTCHGAGEVADGTRDHWGIYGTHDCPTCQGAGIVPADAVSICDDGCQTPFWAGEGCTHDRVLCGDCKANAGRCGECADDARAEAQPDPWAGVA